MMRNIMKNFKFISLLLAAVGVVTFTSCKEEWAPGAPDANLGVYFPSTPELVITADAVSVSIDVARGDVSEAAEVSVRAEDVESCGFFTVPKSVSFAAGEATTKLTIEVQGDKLEVGKMYPLNIQLDQAQASQYGVSQHIFKIGIAEPWKSLGKGLYRDDFLAPMYGGPSGVVVEVEIVQHELEPNRYRMVEPYSEAMCPYIIGGVPSDMTYTGPGYVEFVVDENGNVEIPSSPLGFQLVVEEGGSPEDFFLATVYADENTPLYGKFEDGVFWFTTPQSIMWHIPDGRGNSANKEGLFAVALPGYEIKDYSISAAYAGMVTEADNTTTTAVIEFAVGADVKSYKFTVLEGNVVDTADTVEAIVAGSEDITIFEASADELTWKLDLGATGIYTIVAVPYGAEAEVEDALTYPFYFHKDGGELPKAEFKVFYDSVVNITGNAEYEEQFPEAYFVALGIVGNPHEIKSIKAWIGDANVAANSGMTPAQIVAGYGDDFKSAIDKIRESYDPEKGYGSVVMGPYNMASGSTSCAIVAIQTLYGDTQVFYVEKELPNATGFALGDYKLTDSLTLKDADGKDVVEEYELPIYLTGGTAPGQLIAEMDGFQFLGLIDAETNTVVFDGYEVNDGEDYIFNDIAFYYDAAKTKAFGYFATSDAELTTPADLTFSFEGDKLVGLETYFASCIFKMEEGYPFVGYDFYFSPNATLEYVVVEETPEEEQPETAAVKASVKSLGAELQIGVAVDFTVSTIKAEPFNGKYNRVLVNNATFGF